MVRKAQMRLDCCFWERFDFFSTPPGWCKDDASPVRIRHVPHTSRAPCHSPTTRCATPPTTCAASVRPPFVGVHILSLIVCLFVYRVFPPLLPNVLPLFLLEVLASASERPNHIASKPSTITSLLLLVIEICPPVRFCQIYHASASPSSVSFLSSSVPLSITSIRCPPFIQHFIAPLDTVYMLSFCASQSLSLLPIRLRVSSLCFARQSIYAY